MAQAFWISVVFGFFVVLSFAFFENVKSWKRVLHVSSEQRATVILVAEVVTLSFLLRLLLLYFVRLLNHVVLSSLSTIVSHVFADSSYSCSSFSFSYQQY